MEMVTISKKQYEQLLRDSEKLSVLEGAGVDSWEGYSDAMQLLDDGDDE